MGGIYEKQSKITDYFSLISTNEKLATENAILKELVIKGSSNKMPAMLSIQDPLADKNIDIIPAKVVKTSTNLQHNLITINAGHNKGIKKDMAVISPDGAVGVIKVVSNNYSIVLPLINIEYNVSSKLKNSNYFGSLQWNTNKYRTASLTGIENHIDVSIGDTIVSSGYGAIFPEGVMIGKIKSIKPGKEGVFHNLEVELATDFRRISYVYVIDNKTLQERIELEQNTQAN